MLVFLVNWVWLGFSFLFFWFLFEECDDVCDVLCGDGGGGVVFFIFDKNMDEVGVLKGWFLFWSKFGK